MSVAGQLGGDLLHGFLDLVFAPVCLGCGGAIPSTAANRRVCTVCWSRAREIPRPRCPRCWSPRPSSPAPLPAAPACAVCAALPPAIRAIRSAFLFEGPPRRLVHALKYGGWHGVADVMGERMAALDFPIETEEEAAIVVPVPVTSVRLRQRGYNQAEKLARGVARKRGLRCEPGVLERIRATVTQTTLHAAERRANVAGAFRAKEECGPLIDGEHILLVDDVWTTGATSLACVRALLDGGARAVSVLTFARALPELYR